jgi:thioredoxin 1
MITEINNENFETFIKNEETINIVKIGAEWCGPCRMVKPILEKVSETAEGFQIGDLDADKQKELTMSLGVRSIPTTFFYKNGEQVEKIVGMFTEEKLLSTIDELKK